jgi:hypothetical protein
MACGEGHDELAVGTHTEYLDHVESVDSGVQANRIVKLVIGQ